MADYKVIYSVGDTLIETISSKADAEADVVLQRENIILGSPADAQDDDNVRLSLFLYNILRSEHQNQEMQQLGPSNLAYPPLVLDLLYMITAYSGANEATERTRQEQNILGQVIQIFYDNAIIGGSTLRGSLTGTDAELRVVLTTISMESITQMWNSFEGRAYKPSLFYQVTPVLVDSIRFSESQRVVDQGLDYQAITNR